MVHQPLVLARQRTRAATAALAQPAQPMPVVPVAVLLAQMQQVGLLAQRLIRQMVGLAAVAVAALAERGLKRRTQQPVTVVLVA